jgi:hypothetical protein
MALKPSVRSQRLSLFQIAFLVLHWIIDKALRILTPFKIIEVRFSVRLLSVLRKEQAPRANDEVNPQGLKCLPLVHRFRS